MPTRREFPYIWATWLAPLLTGDRSCEWAVWFKAHHQGWDRASSDFDQTEWQVRHTAALASERETWEERGYEVYVENQNAFRLRGETAVLAGKADLLARKDRDVVIVDVKTGQERSWHRAQVMLYMYALRRSLQIPVGAHVAGEIVYPDKSIRIAPGSIHNGFVEDVGKLIRRLAAERPARKVPTGPECHFCDITRADCTDRIEAGRAMQEETTEDF